VDIKDEEGIVIKLNVARDRPRFVPIFLLQWQRRGTLHSDNNLAAYNL
jgi:hypothetical protein